ncbi:MAG: hypothetical protein RLZZ99_828 [Actinomycetota bacterium]|jgi:catechol 2,3-dioxygenase-like lactoylglutathione lyase family enzyme
MNLQRAGQINSWAWHHTGIAVRDIEKVIDYYRLNLGFEVVFEAREMTDLISSITGVKGLGAHLVQTKSPISDQVLEFIEFTNVPSDANELLPIYPGRSHTAYLVPDIEKAAAELVSSGGIMLGKVTEFSEGKAVYCADRFGTVIELEEQISDSGHHS